MQALNNLAQTWWTWMASMFWQVSLLILFIGILDFLSRKWVWPQVRYALWMLILLKLVIPPTWSLKTSLVSQIRPHVEGRIVQQIPMHSREAKMPERSKADIAERSSQANLPTNDLRHNVFTRETSAAATTVESVTKPAWQTVAMGIWLFGIVLLCSVLVGKMMRLRHWHKQQKKQDIPKWFHELLVKTAQHFDITRLPAIVFNDKAVTPAVYGMFRPVMLLPANYFDKLNAEEAQHVLLHELAHLKRGDLWLNGLTLIMQIIYWFNPLLIWVRRQMKHVREICCDLTVANVLREKTPAYRQTLVNTARELLTETVEPGLGLLGVFEEPFRLVTRLKWLEKKTWEHRRKILGAAVVISLLLAVSVLPMARISVDDDDETTNITNKLEENVFNGAPAHPDISQQWISKEFTIKQTASLYAAVLIKTGDPDNQFEDAIQECRQLLKKQRIKTYGDPFCRFFSDPDDVPHDKWYWEVGFRIKKGKKVKPPLEIRHVVPMQVASLGVAGIKDTESTWDTFAEQLSRQNYVPCFPPATEIYRGEKYDEPMWAYTEMQIPVFNADAGYPGLRIEYRTSDAFQAIVLPMRGSTSQIESAVDQLRRYMRRNKIKPHGRIFAEYAFDWSESPPEEWQWLVGCPIDKEFPIEQPFEMQTFEATDIAATSFTAAPDAEYPWSAFFTQMIIEGYVPVGAAMESWDDVNKKETRVEMRIPSMRIPGWSEGMPEVGADEQEWEAWGKKVGEETKEWALDFSNTLVTALTGHSIEELEQGGNPANIREKVERANAVLERALIDQDTDTYERYLDEDIVVNPPMRTEVRGKYAYLADMQDDFRKGIKFHTFNTQVLECWQCGDNIYEISTFSFSLTTPESSQPWVANGNSFAIWREDENGQLLVKYSIYNTESHPNVY
ncbi:hypothetical protein JXA70_00715 [candidate division KSB1 bacterium]|nr:hypothetical protein [candidate division KSB1 bacterium]